MSARPSRNGMQDDPFAALENQCGPLVKRVWPSGSDDGALRDALREADAESLYESLNRHMRLMHSTLPVVAVVGLVNAGKSSTVSTFLSGAGRTRVLRGIGDDEATQRFVLWCPRSWERDVARRASLEEILAGVFGARLEFLSEDSAAAHAQYNAHSGAQFHTPIIAFDDALDATQFALLDCPDVERPFPGAEGDHSRTLRLEVLKKASAIASALLVVVNHGGAGKEELKEMLKDVLNEMPGISWWLLGNLCRTDYTPDKAFAHCAKVATALQARGVYLAYDYLHPIEEWGERTPAQLHVFRTADHKSRQPAFYLADSDAARNPPNPVEETRFLSHLPAQLDPARGFGQHQRAMHGPKLVSEAETAEKKAREFCAATQKRARTQWEMLLDVCRRSYMDDHGQLIVPLTPQTAARIQRAFLNTAPRRARLAMWPALGVRKAVAWVTAGADYLVKQFAKLLGKPGGEKVQHVAAKVEAQRFVDEMIRHGFALDALPTDKERLHVWNEILMRHKQHEPEQLGEEELEKAMAEVWARRSFATRALDLAAPVLLILLLAACALAPGDGGLSFTLMLQAMGIPAVGGAAGVVLATHVVGFLSISEILLAVGATAALAPAGGYLLEALMRKKLALPGLSNLFACACDAFGLPREIGDPPEVTIAGQTFRVPPSRAARGPVLCALLKSSVWTFHPEGWRRLHAKVQELASEPAAAEPVALSADVQL